MTAFASPLSYSILFVCLDACIPLQRSRRYSTPLWSTNVKITEKSKWLCELCLVSTRNSSPASVVILSERRLWPAFCRSRGWRRPRQSPGTGFGSLSSRPISGSSSVRSICPKGTRRESPTGWCGFLAGTLSRAAAVPENRVEEVPTARRRIGHQPLATGLIGRGGRGMRADDQTADGVSQPAVGEGLASRGAE